jgi:hypothetical protein
MLAAAGKRRYRRTLGAERVEPQSGDVRTRAPTADNPRACRTAQCPRVLMEPMDAVEEVVVDGLPVT